MLYSTAAFASMNRPLRDQSRFKKGEEHPLPHTVAFLRDALGRLREVASQSNEANKLVTLYRGMRDVRCRPEFLEKGGTELAPMSTTTATTAA